jgi:predicted RNA binding protein YcfA (HicA-like mRNA interferase family)
VAHHRGRILPLGTIRAIIEGSGIALTEWLK